EETRGAWRFVGRRWQPDDRWLEGLRHEGQPILIRREGMDQGIRLRDLNDDGRTELLVAGPRRQTVLTWDGRRWKPAPYSLPEDVALVDDRGRDAGMRLIDVDEDGIADILFSNSRQYSL